MPLRVASSTSRSSRGRISRFVARGGENLASGDEALFTIAIKLFDPASADEVTS
jgi:hypothetical protein